GIMEHIEEAGVHSGDSACVIPPYTLSEDIINQIKEYTVLMAKELSVRGLLNIQYAVQGEKVYVLEVNPRASRTVPFVSKSIGIPLAKLAVKIMIGRMLKEIGCLEVPPIEHVSIKEAVLPFGRFPEVDTVLGPEMKSTGEVMGIDKSFGLAFAKAQLSAGLDLPIQGSVFISVRNSDKRSIIMIAKRLKELGFLIYATKGTADMLTRNGVVAEAVKKVQDGRPNVVDLIKNRTVGLVINTPWGRGTRMDGYEIRTSAAAYGIPCITTLAAATAVVQGIEALMSGEMDVKPIQDYHLRQDEAASCIKSKLT
ncbi:MAG: ATP-grasp domain-containing protein, partial [Rubrobacteridae bacterium]|nr:ATP-grasp domain-containing protein [Rubrobacteridae bacterium]